MPAVLSGKASVYQDANVTNLAGIRILAIGLGLCATLWGGLLLFTFGSRPLISIPSGAGYIVTLGYWWIAVKPPSLRERRLVWLASVLVQGGWLCIAIADFCRSGSSPGIVWWLSATVASVLALIIDHEKKSAV
jgi:hypothetical protein